jgi:hypothetical protein
MLAKDLSYAYEHELGARIVSEPDQKAIRKAQGYKA